MENAELFEKILDKDEKIVETFKPNKIRFVLIPFISIMVFIIPFLILGIFLLCDSEEFLPGIFFMSIVFVFVLLGPGTCWIRYKKTAYCYTNKRIIIRTGFIGVDFQAIDFDMIGGMNVRVDLLDKLVKPNTGSIVFVSPASPLINSSQGGVRPSYAFLNINDPYDVYRRVKEFSSKNKDGEFNS